MATRFQRNRKGLLTRYKDSRQPIRLAGGGSAGGTLVDVSFDRPVQIAPGATQQFAWMSDVSGGPNLATATARPDGLTFRFDIGSSPSRIFVWPYQPETKWVTQLASYVDSQPLDVSFE